MTKKQKRVLTCILTLALIAVAAVGGTYAWMTVSGLNATNDFNVLTGGGTSPDMKAELSEPAFTAAVQTNAMKMTPGMTIPKDPTIKNTSTDASITEWVGIRLTFTRGDGTTKLTATEMATLFRVIELDSLSSGWERKDTGAYKATEMFYYKTKLGQGVSTAALFSGIVVKTTAVNADLATVKDTWNGFKIIVDGAAVQGDIGSAWTVAGDKAAISGALDTLLPLS